MTIKSRFAILATASFVGTSCYWAHQDDVFPSAIIDSPITPGTGLVNTVARSNKKIEVTVEIGSPQGCLFAYSYNQLRFDLVRLDKAKVKLVKSFEPDKRTSQFITRLEDGARYEGRLVRLRDESIMDRESFEAAQEDRTIHLAPACRNSQKP